MNQAMLSRLPRRSSTVRFSLTMLWLVLSSTVALSQKQQKSKPIPIPKPTVAPGASATPAPRPTPETKIDSKMEAELLQAEDRYINAIRNRDAKELDQILHPHFADSIQGSESAITKGGFIMRVTSGARPAYQVAKERKLTRSGDSFTVEGLARDVAHELTEDHPTEQWAHVRRIWTKESGQWIATAQIVTPLEENEVREKVEAEKKEKQPN
jgi:hypothetical protein